MASICSRLAPRESIIGLDIGDRLISASQLVPDGHGQYRLLKAGWVDCEPGASDRSVASAIKKLWRRSGIHTYSVCSALNSRSMSFKFFRYPAMSPEDLASALRLEAEQMLQIPPGNIAMDWHTGRSADPEKDNGEVEGVLVAVPMREVERHMAILQMAGLYPIIVDVVCMAMSNLFLQLAANMPSTEVTGLVHLSHHTADIAIISQGGNIYPRTVFARPVPWDEAIDYLVENITDELRYYRFKLRRPPVERLFFTGRIPSVEHSEEGIREERLLSSVRRETGLPVEFWDPLPCLKIRDASLERRLAAEPEIGPALAPSLGLAMRRDSLG